MKEYRFKDLSKAEQKQLYEEIMEADRKLEGDLDVN